MNWLFQSAFIVLSGLIYGTLSQDDCRTLTFKHPIEDRALKDHVITHVNVTSDSQCQIKCYLESDCVSINIGQPNEGNHHVCELSDSDHAVHPGDLEPRSGFTFIPVENPCSSGPCSSNSQCQVGFTDDGYRCLCPPGFTGKNCDVDIDECADRSHNCSYPNECNNLVGSFNCTLVILDEFGGGWVAFWWWKANSTWPAGETDVLAKAFGQCLSEDPVCLGRLPGFLQEDQTELLATDSEGNVYKWHFDSGHEVAHAAWKAFYLHQSTEYNEVVNEKVWNPMTLRGTEPVRDQDSFMYRMENGVMSLILDDDACDCTSSLNMGHGMCLGGFMPSISLWGQLGVDRLYDPVGACSTDNGGAGPKTSISVNLYFRPWLY